MRIFYCIHLVLVQQRGRIGQFSMKQTIYEELQKGQIKLSL